MSFYLGDIVQAQFKRDNETPLTIYYRIDCIIFSGGEIIYKLDLLHGNLPDRNIQCRLIDSEFVTYRKVIDGTDKGNDYFG